MTKPEFRSDQEAFWAGDFGDSYISRNESRALLASNINFFAKALRISPRIGSCVEFGANIGMNLRALQQLYPECRFRGVEINSKAAAELGERIGAENVFCGSILDYQPAGPADLALIKGVLIHINPELLPAIYEKLHEATGKYLLVCEYYNPSPVAIPYRGHTDRLFKRDFAGEILDAYPDLKLVDYGFAYHRDPAFPQDDISWFLMEKKAR
jgi:spore coat polysaccharide biosynthesis protein SpsF